MSDEATPLPFEDARDDLPGAREDQDVPSGSNPQPAGQDSISEAEQAAALHERAAAEGGPAPADFITQIEIPDRMPDVKLNVSHTRN